MGFTKESAVERAKQDLSERIRLGETASIKELSVSEKDFPDMSLGAPIDGEMSAQMIASGWEILLGAEGNTYEYRADRGQLRMVDFRGTNHVVE